MYCTKCGQQLPNDAAFCSKCGTKVTESLNNQDIGENNTEDITTTQQDSNQHSSMENNDNSSNKKIISSLLTLLFIVGWYFIYPKFFSSSRSDSVPTSSTKNAVSNKVRTDSLMNGDQEEAIRRLLGEPDEVTESHIDNKTTTRRYSYDGLYITARNGIVDYIKKDLQVINDAPIRRRDSFTKVRWYRGAPLREEKVVVEKNDVDVRPLNLYEYPDYVIITNCPEFKKQREIVLGFVPKGGFNITTTSIGIREVTFTTAVNMDGDIPLKVAESNNAPATVNQQTVEQKTTNKGDSNVSNYVKSSVPKNHIISAEHSSADAEGSYVHSAALAIDNNPASCWSEGVPGLGIGESIVIGFNNTYKVSGMRIWIGHQKSQDLFYKNARPSAIRVLGSDGSNQLYNVQDVFGPQDINFVQPVNANSIKLIIEKAKPGSTYEDTCISEVLFY